MGEAALDSLPEKERAQYLRSFDVGMSKVTKALNSTVGAHLQTLGRSREGPGGVDDPAMRRLSKLDCAAILLKANKEIKTIKGQLEQRAIIPLKTTGVGDGARGPANPIEVYPECQVVCKVDVVDRKAPLKIHLSWGGAQAPNLAGQLRQKLASATGSMYASSGAKVAQKRPQTSKARVPRPGRSNGPTSPKALVTGGQRGDLRVHVAAAPHNLQDQNCSQSWSNPGARMVIRDPQPAGVDQATSKRRYQRRDEDLFACDAVYIGFSSVRGCTISISCALIILSR